MSHQPPKHLSADSKRRWRQIVNEFEIDTHSATLLQGALEQWDRAQEARELVTAEGLVVNGRRHPATDVEKQAYGLFLRYVRELGLNIEPPGPMGRPPSRF